MVELVLSGVRVRYDFRRERVLQTERPILKKPSNNLQSVREIDLNHYNNMQSCPFTCGKLSKMAMSSSTKDSCASVME